MASIGYMTIKGSKQGEMNKGATSADSIGTNKQDAHQDEISVVAFTCNAIVPRNPLSGAVTGERMHQPATFVKFIDKATPMLWQALATGETLTEVQLQLFRTSTTGQQEHYFTIKWENAVLVDGKSYIPHVLMQENQNLGHMEDWAFVYSKVTWTHEKAGTSGSDDWNKPAS